MLLMYLLVLVISECLGRNGHGEQLLAIQNGHHLGRVSAGYHKGWTGSRHFGGNIRFVKLARPALNMNK